MILPDNSFWLRLMGVVGAETAVVLGAVFILQRFVPSAALRRAVWQVGFVSLLIIVVSELSGFGRGFGRMIFGQARSAQQVTVQTMPAATVTSVPQEFSGANAAEASTSPGMAIRWPAVIWAGGLALVLMRIAAAQGLLGVLRLRSSSPTDMDLQGRVKAVSQKLGIERTFGIIHAPGLKTPIAFGLLRPTIALPARFSESFSTDQQDAMLAHELAHLAENDPKWYLLIDILTACLWWHPMVWWARRQFQDASELTADEATAVLSKGPESLAECLVELGKAAIQQRRWAWTGVDGGFRSSLGKRVERLLSLRPSRRSNARHRSTDFLRVVAVIAICGMILFGTGWVQGQGLTKERDWQTAMKHSWQNSAGGALLLAATEPPASSEPKQSEKFDPKDALSGSFESPLSTDHNSHEPLVTKTFVLHPPGIFYAASATDEVRVVMQMIENAGARPHSFYYSHGGGTLTVEATSNKLARIENIVTNSIMSDANAPDSKIFDKAKRLYEEKHYDAAEALFKNIKAQDPSNQRASFYLHWIKLAREVGVVSKEVSPGSAPAVRATSNSTNEPPALFSKTFQLDPQSFEQELKSAGLEMTNKSAAARAFFETAGLNFSPGKAVLYNSQTGTLYVRTTFDDLAVIENLLNVVNRPQPQVVIEVRVFQASLDSPHGVPGLFELSQDETGILTRSQFDVVYKALSKYSDIALLATPTVTILSGRQARISIAGEGTNQPTRFELDVLPQVLPDGYTVQITVNPKLTELSSSAPGETPTPHTKTLQTTCNVWDGQTLVLKGMDSVQDTKRTLIFVTPTLIDPAGNRLHPEPTSTPNGKAPAKANPRGLFPGPSDPARN